MCCWDNAEIPDENNGNLFCVCLCIKRTPSKTLSYVINLSKLPKKFRNPKNF